MHVPNYIPVCEILSKKVGDLFLYAKEGSGVVQDVLHKYGYKALHIVGDTDGACTLDGIRNWIKSLKWEKTSGWEPWFYGEEVIGYTRKYGNYTLITIHGEGHSAM